MRQRGGNDAATFKHPVFLSSLVAQERDAAGGSLLVRSTFAWLHANPVQSESVELVGDKSTSLLHLTFAQRQWNLESVCASRVTGTWGYSWNANDGVRRLLNRRGAIIVRNHLASYSIATTERVFVLLIASRHIKVALMI